MGYLTLVKFSKKQRKNNTKERVNKMGQYFTCVNHTKKEQMSPGQVGNTLKLTESSYVNNQYMFELLMKLKEDWCGDEIAQVGDYDESSRNKEGYDNFPATNIVYFDAEMNGEIESFYHQYYRNMHQMSEKEREELDNKEEKEKIPDFIIKENAKKDLEWSILIKYNVLVNFTKKEYCEIDCCPTIEEFQICPLPILTASSNGLGGGDYFEDSDIDSVGTWSNDHIGVISKGDKRLKDMTKKTFHFLPF